MRRIAAALFCIATVVSAAGAETPFAKELEAWNKPAEPFHIIGPVYYVGTSELSVHLIATPAGLILIDQGVPDSPPLIAASIEKLGFKLSDVKLLIAGHAHFDHVGGLAVLQKRTGATVVASAADTPFLEAGHISYGPSKPVAFAPVKVGRVVHDGETVSLGGITLTAHLTPGHTPGCLTWTLPVSENSVTHTVLFAGSTSVGGNPLVNVPEYPAIATDFRASFAKLKAMKADVLLTEHQWAAGEIDRAKKAAPGAPNPFVDASALPRYVEASERDFEKQYAEQQAKR